MKKRKPTQILSTKTMLMYLCCVGLFAALLFTDQKKYNHVEIMLSKIEQVTLLDQQVDYLTIQVGRAAARYHHCSITPRILLGQQFARVDDIPLWLEYEKVPEDRSKIEVLLVIDKHVPMKIVGAIKKELSKAGIQKICYQALP